MHRLTLAIIGLLVLPIPAVPEPTSPVGCDAVARIIVVEQERARREYEQECLRASGMPDNPFAKLACGVPP
jgi:hypothetical protein